MLSLSDHYLLTITVSKYLARDLERLLADNKWPAVHSEQIRVTSGPWPYNV